ncbi:hypothetical protein EBB59_11040 [Lysobacter pythonis]|uniref:DUF4124 domain-containing protein n=2 Tax=Solilutibacter pythonis TaxID=2483112 RepID=A0A3M2HN56_9GAMM|nr:hypothetical protein EBB59_11040 [Lysobacter pythonis]
MRITGPTALFATLLALGLAPLAPAQEKSAEKRLYCWNEDGRRICADALPASAVNSARTEMSGKTGLPNARIERAPTAEEQAAQRVLEARQKLENELAQARKRADLALAESYESEAALQRAYKIRYDLVDQGIKTARMAIDNQHMALLRLLQNAADAELQGGEVSATLAKNVRNQRAAVMEAQQSLRQQQQERVALDSALVEAVARWRRARGLDAAPTPETTASGD